MGIVKNWVVKAGNKAGDAVASLSQLSPMQLSEVQQQKDDYMSEMPDPDDPQAVELTARLLAENGVEIYNSYLSQIKQLYIPLDPTAEYGRDFDPGYNIRYFNITKWVTNKEENSLEKLVNVYAVLSNEECNIALVFNRTKEKTNVYLAVVNIMNRNSNDEVNILSKRIESAIKGNFPGSEITEITGKSNHREDKSVRIKCLDKIENTSVAIASNLPTEKSEKFISQTIEKLLDGYIPLTTNEEYTIILLATPVTDVNDRKQELSRIYSGLVPYSQWSTNYTYTQSDSTTGMASIGVNIGASAGIQRGINETQTKTQGMTKNEQNSQADNISETQGKNTSSTETESINNTNTINKAETKTNTTGRNKSTATAIGTGSAVTKQQSSSKTEIKNFSLTEGLGTGDIIPVKVNIQASEGISTGKTTSLSTAISDINNITKTASEGSSSAYSVATMSGHSTATSVGTALAKTTGASVANTVGRTLTSSTGRAITNGLAKAVGTAKSSSLGANVGANFARTSSVTATIGKNEGITQNFANFEIIHALEVLKEQMKRYETGTALGMWDFAAYVLSNDFNIANNVAHSYLALTQGEESYMSDCAVNIWRHDTNEDKANAESICKYLIDLRHPQFGLNPSIVEKEKTFLIFPTAVTATTTLSGKELAYSLNFPRKSIAGLPVFECAEFGRNVSTFEKKDEDISSQLKLGKIFHMHSVENADVSLSFKSLTSHVFVTGSTGSGKSNTVYKIINESLNSGIKFMVIEPAKGEYKNIFGNRSDVFVYGTNSKISELLRINPFSFPDSIHIYEHMDRLVEIFNVCWPMYAAMPAVLKNAIEKAYEDCGWNLVDSTNNYGKNYYPSFADVARNIKGIIDTSEYDTDNKGAYKGSLLTRLQSLSNGINGQVFSSDDIPEEKLFEENTIIDLSRVGSNETKSLLMGILVLKLQEYRMSIATRINQPLKHITIIEEAHHILKKTSMEQPVEGGNLVGKSVEMISNAIAEMRTYGESFVIVDQSPGLMDLSTIRNTNTKIIMRLPDQSDRELVGKAAALNDDQIKELAILPCGVAAIYQNEWIQPVLCKIDKVEMDESRYLFAIKNKKTLDPAPAFENRIYIAEILSKGMSFGKELDRKQVIDKLETIHLSDYEIISIIKMLEKPPKEPDMTKLAPVMNALFPDIKKMIQRAFINENDIREWTREANEMLIKYKLDDQVRRDIIQATITHYMINETNNRVSLENWIQRGGFR